MGWEEGGNGDLLHNGDRVSVWDDKRFLQMDSGGLCITLWMNLMSVQCALKMVKMVNLMCVSFTTVKINE